MIFKLNEIHHKIKYCMLLSWKSNTTGGEKKKSLLFWWVFWGLFIFSKNVFTKQQKVFLQHTALKHFQRATELKAEGNDHGIITCLTRVQKGCEAKKKLNEKQITVFIIRSYYSDNISLIVRCIAKSSLKFSDASYPYILVFSILT